MRQPNSLFNHSCEFINSIPVGKTFTSAEYIAAIGHRENVTSWKRHSKNPHYNCHQYKGYLRRAGFISNVKIMKKHRGHGYCTKLVSKIVHRAKQMKIQKLYLHVRHDNGPAIKCYKNNKFIKIVFRGS